ncbi:PD-(D/E)XK nuclease-like domain-containing protein [Mycobacterium sp. CVI_P3]|uniref:PD-(D/E)XK nuclease-like domain-containing protein n=1 Tax=Mycobacterium pinniadriaticum TaxID=2994102 RepID=A0ABT3SE42_9MYCO|nr:PD-(D/E)XK nuclease-like domain-containing protein [Mycobacterium pinniadriaticum]MCX2931354.1 PD-(D/E)XK nuclease-like domain-containing protein [Mycobacterium pinniadriaticum]MCX2937778.1 PD-(D/E)XK nuclease-like domain-containing protein [Mycobacterium pinniadriaticum]
MTAAVITAPPEDDGLHPGISDNSYHADRESLSSSGARRLLSTCPAKFHHEQSQPPKPKAVYDFGHLVHHEVLGEGAELVILVPEVHGVKADGKPSEKPTATTMWKDAEAEARSRGAVPVHVADYLVARAMREQVYAHPIARKLLEHGYPELSGYWHDRATGIRLRYRPDFLAELPGGRIVCVDYKSAADASPGHFAKASADYGYFQQDPWYREGLIANDITDDPAFVFIAQEKEPPYLVSVLQHQADDVQRGRDLNRIAVDRYAHCVGTGEWPGYGDGTHIIRMPSWFAAQHQARVSALTPLVAA